MITSAPLIKVKQSTTSGTMYKFLVALALLSGVSAFAPNQFARSALRSGAPRRATRASLEMKALLL